MKIVILLARILMGLIFVIFGSNAFLHFIKAPLPSGLAGQFLLVLFQSNYVLFIGAVQVLGGVLLIVNRYVPLALALLGPVIVNILLYHGLLNHGGAGPAIFVTICWFILFFHLKQYFAGIFTPTTA